MFKIVFVWLCFCWPNILVAQTCDWFPADCPETGNIEAATDSMVGINNLLVPQEITMQRLLRQKIMAIMEPLAREKKWQWYVCDEASGGGIGTNGVPLAYAYRRPHQYTIVVNCIVNNDSLQAWKDWYNNTLHEKADAVVNAFQQVNNSGANRYLDSANRYGTLMTQYINDHATTYQKAIMNNDVAEQKRYDAAVKQYQDKINYFTQKGNAATANQSAAATANNTQLQEDKKRIMNAYRNASCLRLTFIFNEAITPTLTHQVKLVNTLPVERAAFAGVFHNSDPDATQLPGSFLTSTDFAVLLWGNWNTQAAADGSYSAAYRLHTNAVDNASIKKIPCDKVQTIFMGMEGGKKYINAFLQSLPAASIHALLNNN